jgi:murein DD-endopeptidase MepM/ murein hydrolase activator NlpD
MLDKEIIKFTRNGIQRKNLSTGETKMLTQSNYAGQIKYKLGNKESIYQSKHGKVSAAPTSQKFYVKNTANKVRKANSQSGYQDQSRDRTPYQSQGQSQSQSRSAPYYSSSKKQPGQQNKTQSGYGFGTDSKVSHSGKNADEKYYYTAKVTGNKIQTHADLRKGRLKRINGKILHSAVNSVSQDMKESDNAGLSAIGQSVQTVSRTRSRIGRLKKAWKRDSFVRKPSNIHNTEFTAAKNASKWRAAYQKQSAVRNAKNTQAATGRIGKAVQVVVKALINPATLKFIAIAAAIILVVVIISEMSSSSMMAVVGSTKDNPELTAYVEQLDSDFLKNIDSLKVQYEKNSDNTVKIEGDEQINTDPNVLAIMATGDWVVIDLTPDNKTKLAKYHGLLNTYSVTKTDEKVKEETPSASGSTTEETKTIHHITIQVRVYAPEEIISNCGYTDSQKKNVLEMLEFLSQITGETGETTDSAVSGYLPVGDGEFHWPVPGHFYISSGYGTRIDPVTKTETAFHTGLDIPVPIGTSVLASADGTVIRAGWNSGFGNCVIIQHKNGVQTLYGHNSELVVKKGDVVKQGQVIAKSGNTGRTTGPHCHFEFRINGHHVDPEPYLKGVSKE